MSNNWPFAVPEHTAVFTTRDILSGEKQILFVSHDKEDGSWQFLSGDKTNRGPIAIVALREIVELDQTIKELSDLATGSYAVRKDSDSSWEKH